jgi:hypothetical protein
MSEVAENQASMLFGYREPAIASVIPQAFDHDNESESD